MQHGRVVQRRQVCFPGGQRDAQGRCAARIAHGFIGVGRDRLAAARARRGDLGGRQQRAFDLDEVQVVGGRDARVAHRLLHGRGRLLDLGAAADLLGQEVARERNAQREPLGAGKRCTLRGPPREHRVVR
ncbi:hypothetical protein D3C71_1747960 [compost metagenome]